MDRDEPGSLRAGAAWANAHDDAFDHPGVKQRIERWQEDRKG